MSTTQILQLAALLVEVSELIRKVALGEEVTDADVQVSQDKAHMVMDRINATIQKED